MAYFAMELLDLPGKSCQHWGSSRHSPGKLLPQGESVAYTLREALATKQSLWMEVLSRNSKACTMQSFCYTTFLLTRKRRLAAFAEAD
jgi:hypothetical protein